ncbi:MAG: hypothetical protein H7832_03280 [Magnetococcus sp. DMHC-6]
MFRPWQWFVCAFLPVVALAAPPAEELFVKHFNVSNESYTVHGQVTVNALSPLTGWAQIDQFRGDISRFGGLQVLLSGYPGIGLLLSQVRDLGLEAGKIQVGPEGMDVNIQSLVIPQGRVSHCSGRSQNNGQWQGKSGALQLDKPLKGMAPVTPLGYASLTASGMKEQGQFAIQNAFIQKIRIQALNLASVGDSWSGKGVIQTRVEAKKVHFPKESSDSPFYQPVRDLLALAGGSVDAGSAAFLVDSLTLLASSSAGHLDLTDIQLISSKLKATGTLRATMRTNKEMVVSVDLLVTTPKGNKRLKKGYQLEVD